MSGGRTNRTLWWGLALALLAFPAAARGEVAWMDGHPVDPGTLIVELAPDADPSAVDAALRANGLSLASVSRQDGTRAAPQERLVPGEVASHAVARVPAGMPIREALARARTTPGVASAWPNHFLRLAWVPNDPYYQKFQFNFRQVYAEEAWELSRGYGVTVAVIDTGYRTIDLVDTAALLADPEDLYDFHDEDSDVTDGNGHGTLVANTVAERTNNGILVAGLAHHARLMPLKIFPAGDEPMASESDLIDAVNWAVGRGADVINLSLGGAGYNAVTEQALRRARDAGAVLVCASGNEGQSQVTYPGRYDACLAVGSVSGHAKGARGVRSDFSSYGPGLLLLAPGEGIVQETWSEDFGVGLHRAWGTSAAAPHVAAVAAMMIARGGQGDPEMVREVLGETAQDMLTDGWDAESGFGELHAADAVEEYGARFGMAPTARIGHEVHAGNRVQFDAGASEPGDAPLAAYFWDFGDGLTSGGAAPVHRYAHEGRYSVLLTVIDAEGRSDTTASEVHVRLRTNGRAKSLLECGMASGDALPLAAAFGALLGVAAARRRRFGRAGRTSPRR